MSSFYKQKIANVLETIVCVRLLEVKHDIAASFHLVLTCLLGIPQLTQHSKPEIQINVHLQTRKNVLY